MVKVGVVGIGMMGSTHLDVYSKRDDVKVVAVADIIEGRRTGKEKAAGNIEGQAKGGFDFNSATQYDEGMKLIADPNVELVDICLQTPQHLEYAKAAIRAGKHVMVEKPLARTAAQALELADLAKQAKGLTMSAMCMRFWPGWTWLKQVITDGRYGKVLAAQFRRVASHPGGPFYSDGDRCGGAILDLHIHDTDFIQYCLGKPKAVTSVGYSSITSAIDHVVTQYHYDDVPLVVAEGGWAFAPGFNFTMQYAVNFEKASAVFDLAAKDPLMLYDRAQKPQAVELEPGMGYDHEIAYFLNCIKTGRPPQVVTLQDAAYAVKIVEAERQSVLTGKTVNVD
jgi:predicted dehydrogenase